MLRVLLPQFNSREAAGRVLAHLALGTVKPPAGAYYVALRRDVLTWREPFALARCDDLWRDSTKLVEPIA